MEKKKRIAFFHSSFPAGGTERVTMDITEYVTAHHCEVYVMACRWNRDKKDIPHITPVDLPDEARLSSIENAKAIIRALNELEIDVFVLPIHMLGSLDLIRKETSCKIIFSLHNKPLWEVSCLLYQKKKNADTFLKKLEWYLITYPKAAWLKKYDKRYIRQYRNVYDKVDAFTVLCDEYKSELIERMHLSPSDNKIVAIGNTEKAVECPQLAKKKQIIFVGALSYEHKRVDRLIDIWGMIGKQAPDWELILVGDGVDKKMFENQVKRMRLERIHFAGSTNRPQDYYKDAAIVCLTSTFEGWGLCLTEGQANGVIPVVFDSYAAAHHIVGPSGVNGFLIPPFDKKEYARVLLSLMNDPQLREKIQKNVLSKSKTYSPQAAGEKWMELFNR